MGVYGINCSSCGLMFDWFSGYSFQNCPGCGFVPVSVDENLYGSKKEMETEKEKSKEDKLLESLDKIIKLQDEIIKMLRSEVESLKNRSNLTSPNVQPLYQQGTPVSPLNSPNVPPYIPNLVPPYQIICDSTGTLTLAGNQNKS